MSTNEIKGVSEIAKNVSEAAKNFQTVVDNILQPKGLNLVISKAHEKIIEDYFEMEDSPEKRMAFIGGYKKMVKEHQRCVNVVEQAMPLIENRGRPFDIEEDWLDFFFDKARLISDETVRNIWAKILAGEVNEPQKYSRALLHTLSIMSNSQAMFFCNISRFCLCGFKEFNKAHPLIFISANVEAYKLSGITIKALLELQQLGLIQCVFDREYTFDKAKDFRAGNRKITILGDDKSEYIKAGNVVFTKDGQSLYDMIGEEFKIVDSRILDYTIEKFKARGCKVLINSRSC